MSAKDNTTIDSVHVGRGSRGRCGICVTDSGRDPWATVVGVCMNVDGTGICVVSTVGGSIEWIAFTAAIQNSFKSIPEKNE